MYYPINMEYEADEKIKITILGVRGSIPVSGKDMLSYGGATSCILVRAGGQAIFLDAGTGIINAPDIGDEPVTILLTHPHLDHVLGIPFIPYLTEKDRTVSFYIKKSQELQSIFCPPAWPCGIDVYPADVSVQDAVLPMRLGDVEIDGIDSVHPGNGTVYKLSYRGKSIVYATDYEYDEAKVGSLIAFAENADLLFFDGQYTDDEYAKKRGYGHSTVSQGLIVMKEANVKQLLFVHHDPGHNDRFLKAMEDEVRTNRIAFAREGESIEL